MMNNIYATYDRKIEHYKELVVEIERGYYESSAKEISQLRKSDSALDATLRFLLSTRLALKCGENSFIFLTVEKIHDGVYLKAEYHFVYGLYDFQNNRYERGSQHFLKASQKYQAVNQSSREILSRYNACIGKLFYLGDDYLLTAVHDLKNLQTMAASIDDKKMLGLIHRQNSYNFQRLQRLNAALEEAQLSAYALQLFAYTSDFQLTLCQLADCYISLNRESEAALSFEKIVPPIDSRVEMAYDYINYRINGKELNLDNYSTLNQFWLKKYQQLTSGSNNSSAERLSKISWDIRDGGIYIENSKTDTPIKYNSLEGKMLKFVSKNKISKDLLIEQLWPDESCMHTYLDNRLHRLISRLNKKLQNMITFDGLYYSLSGQLEIKRY